MPKKLFHFAPVSTAALILALPFALAVWAYPRTANCPIDGDKAKATGKKKSTLEPNCTNVEYKHKGTDYSDPRNPQRFNHVFWITQCDN